MRRLKMTIANHLEFHIIPVILEVFVELAIHGGSKERTMVEFAIQEDQGPKW